jgi:hypothetical protein
LPKLLSTLMVRPFSSVKLALYRANLAPTAE